MIGLVCLGLSTHRAPLHASLCLAYFVILLLRGDRTLLPTLHRLALFGPALKDMRPVLHLIASLVLLLLRHRTPRQ
jgi:hypothetical protein